jgi:hypothetical protein
MQDSVKVTELQAGQKILIPFFKWDRPSELAYTEEHEVLSVSDDAKNGRPCARLTTRAKGHKWSRQVGLNTPFQIVQEGERGTK